MGCGGPSVAEPAGFECPACLGRDAGCPVCGGGGVWELTECPLRVVPPEIWDAIEAADLAAKGLMPVAGGTLDQAAVFLDFCRAAWAEQKSAECKMKGAL